MDENKDKDSKVTWWEILAIVVFVLTIGYGIFKGVKTGASLITSLVTAVATRPWAFIWAALVFACWYYLCVYYPKRKGDKETIKIYAAGVTFVIIYLLLSAK